MKILIIYPHGLGDCILLTPALREYKNKTGNFIGIATLERFKSACLFNNCPYINEIIYTKDVWNDFKSFQDGCLKIYEFCKNHAVSNNYNDVIFIKHSANNNKILDCAENLNVKLNNFQTEIFTTSYDVEYANKIVKDIHPFGFIQTTTGVKEKDFPEGFGFNWLKTNKNLENVVEVGVSFNQTDFDINKQFEIMRLSKSVCLVDSVFYHACHAMNKEVDFVYFAKGESIYNRVKPLHTVKENVVFQL